MHHRQLRALVCLIFSLAWLPAVAAPSETSNGATQVVDASAGVAATDAAREPAAAAKPAWLPTGEAAKASVAQNRKSRLKFRTSDGTCACTCASGGISEATIQQAETAMREQARR